MQNIHILNTNFIARGLAFVLLVFYLFSCQREASTEDLTTIKVEASDNALSSKEVLDTLFFMPLRIPDSLYIANADVLKVYGDRIYLLDSYKGASISIFSKNGEFINQLSKKGNGPEEYGSLESFCVDLSAEEIIINDRDKRRLFIYDLNSMDFKTSYPSNFYFTNIESIGSSLLTVSDEDVSSDEYRGLDVWKNSQLTENLIHEFGQPVAAIELTFPESFSRINDKLFYSRPLEDIVYQVSQSGFEPYLQIDFQDKKIPQKHDTQTDADRFEFEIDKNGLFLAPHLFNETQEMISFWFYKGSDSKQLYVYQKANSEGKNISYVRGDFGLDILPPPLAVSNGYYISVISQDMLDIEQLEDNYPELHQNLETPSDENEEGLILLFYRLKI